MARLGIGSRSLDGVISLYEYHFSPSKFGVIMDTPHTSLHDPMPPFRNHVV